MNSPPKNKNRPHKPHSDHGKKVIIFCMKAKTHMTKHHHTKKPLKTKRIRFDMPEVETPKPPQEPFHNKPEFTPTIKNLSYVSNKSGSGHAKKKKKKHHDEADVETMLETPLPQVETVILPPPEPSSTKNTVSPSAAEETVHKMYPTRYYPPLEEKEQPEPLKFGMAFHALMRQGSGFTRKLYH